MDKLKLLRNCKRTGKGAQNYLFLSLLLLGRLEGSVFRKQKIVFSATVKIVYRMSWEEFAKREGKEAVRTYWERFLKPINLRAVFPMFFPK